MPRCNLLGRRGRGFALAQQRLGPGRIHHCMRWLGISQRAFDLMCTRARRRPITAESTLAERDLVRTWVAESELPRGARIYDGPAEVHKLALGRTILSEAS